MCDMHMFEDERFDVAFDKGMYRTCANPVAYLILCSLPDPGTMDAMMTSKGDVWNPPQKDIDTCNREVDEVLR